MHAVGGRLRCAFEMDGKTVTFADGVEAAIRRSEGEAQHVAIERDGAIEIVDQELRREADQPRCRRHDLTRPVN